MAEALPPIWAMRHGETEWNQAGRLQGHDDSPLTETGRTQAREAGRRLASALTGEALRLASPSGRTQATARLVFGPAPFDTDPQLLEIGTGTWTGQRLDDLAARHPAIFAASIAYDWYDHAPQGETLAGVAARVAAFLAALPARAQGRPVAIVTHGITLRVLRAQVLGLTLADETALHFPQGTIHHLRDGRAELI